MKGRKQYSYSTPSRKTLQKATRFFIKEVYHLPFFALSSFNPHTLKYSQNFVKVVVIVVVNPKTITKKKHVSKSSSKAARRSGSSSNNSSLQPQ